MVARTQQLIRVQVIQDGYGSEVRHDFRQAHEDVLALLHDERVYLDIDVSLAARFLIVRVLVEHIDGQRVLLRFAV